MKAKGKPITCPAILDLSEKTNLRCGQRCKTVEPNVLQNVGATFLTCNDSIVGEMVIFIINQLVTNLATFESVKIRATYLKHGDPYRSQL